MLTQQRLKEVITYHENGTLTFNNHYQNKASGRIAGADDGQGYIGINVDGKYYRAHRLVWLYVHGVLPGNGTMIDHINRIRSDNRIVNLRLATPSNNQCNQKLRCTNKTGYKGIKKEWNKWSARIKVNKKEIFLGMHSTPEGAYFAYCVSAIEHHKEFANFG